MSLLLRPWTGDAQSYLDGTEELLARHESRIRALTAVDFHAARNEATQALGPLGGMPILVKEIIDVAGQPVTFGSQLFAGRVAERDATAVASLRQAGATVLGMTTTTPFACGTTTVTDNPRQAGHTPGGSSAGSGAAVGAGYVPLALASQSQASTLRPASYCGAWGFKPSHLRFARQGMRLLSDTLDDLGLIAASLADLTNAFDVLANTRSSAPETDAGPLRVAVLGLDHGGLPRASTRAAFTSFIHGLPPEHILVTTESALLREVDNALAGSGYSCFDIFAGESADTLAQYVAAGETDPRLAQMVEHAQGIAAGGVHQALVRRDQLRDKWGQLAHEFDVVLSLSTTNPAPKGHASTGCRRMPATSSLLGIPALSAPWLTVDRMPQGVQLLGFDGRDEELLQAARILQKHRPSLEVER